MSWLRSLITTVAAFAILASAGTDATERVNINTADAATLASVLNGVGLRKAEAIVRHRETNGRFDKPADLANVKGIGSAILAKNADKIIVSEAGSEDAKAKTGKQPPASAPTDDM